MRCPTPSLLAVYLSVIECRTVSPEWHMRSRRHRGYCIAHAHTYCMLYECITGRGVGAVPGRRGSLSVSCANQEPTHAVTRLPVLCPRGLPPAQSTWRSSTIRSSDTRPVSGTMRPGLRLGTEMRLVFRVAPVLVVFPLVPSNSVALIIPGFSFAHAAPSAA